MNWRDGLNRLRLDVSAPPSPAATANLQIPWPPLTDPTLLPQVLAAMRAVPTMTAHQAVTSNYTGYPGGEIPVPISGTDYLAAEPYATGGGDPVILGSAAGETQIGLAFPQGIAIRLFVGADDRILREEETTPNHLITTTFEYHSAAK